MRILHLTTHMRVGGVPKYVASLAMVLHQAHEVEYVCVASAGGVYADTLQACGINTFTCAVGIKSVMHPAMMRAFFQLYAYIKKHNIQVIHAHTRVTQVLAWFLSRATGARYVTTWHGYFKKRLGRVLFPLWAKHVVAISDAVASDLDETFHCPAARVRVIYNGIDAEAIEVKQASLDRDAEKKRLGIGDAKPVVGVVARLTEDKGISCLINAAAMLVAQYPALQVVIVGSGDHEAALRALVADKGLTAHVIFAGTQEDIAPFLKVMDVFALPVLQREGFGLAVVEAMAAGVPVVVSNVGGLPNVVTDGRTGRVIPAGDCRRLADAIIDLVEQKDTTRGLCANAVAEVNERFTVQKMTEQMITLYKECVKA